ncbi:MAG: class I SAM-dependent methyltransferase [Patescibacteria group bacterium]|nr:class I SAM-dependent methyltransferase [Patescibacteria group bacterium]
MSQYSQNKFVESDNHSWSLLYKYINDNAKVLDIGCSSGSFGAALITSKNCTVDGIEIFHDDAVAASKQLRNVYEVNVEADQLTEITDKYDFIVFADVLEHLIDPVLALTNVKKLLKPNGSVIYSIPNMAHISIRLALLKGDFDYTETGLLDETHIHFYNQKNIERIFSESGYVISDQKYTYANYPVKFIEETLGKSGLIVQDNDIFDKKMSDVDAQAFQFIGQALVTTHTKRHTVIKSLPHKMDTKELNKILTIYEKTVKDDREALKAQTEQIDQLNNALLETSNTLTSLHNSLSRIQNSLSWKITKPLRLASRLLHKIK